MSSSGRAADGLSIIEQLHALRCETPNRPLLRALSEDRKLVLYFRPRCKSWNCPACAETNKRLWTARIYEGTSYLLQMGASISFTTLTTHEKLSSAQSVKLFSQQWRKLHMRARRATGSAIREYVLIPEKHKSGKLHAHMLDTFSLDTRWWKDNARACGMGFMAESEFAKTPGGAANYASKYLGKQLNERWIKNFRRVRKSQHFLNSSGRLVGAEWDIEKLAHEVSLQEDSRSYTLAGYEVKILDYWEVYEAMQDPQD